MYPFLLIGILAYLFYSAGTELADKISFEPVGFNLSQSILTLKIKNPTDTSATIQSVQGVVLSNKNQIGQYNVTSPFEIPAKSAVTIKVKIKLDPTAVIQQVSDLLIKKKTPVITITGSIGTGFGSIKFENELVSSVNLHKNA